MTRIKTPNQHIQEYNKKIKITGKHAEIIIYPMTLTRGFKRAHEPKRQGGKTMANKYTIQRARKKVLDIVNTNMTEHTKMLTLTYAKTELSHAQLNRDFKVFMQNLKSNGFKDLPYLSVVEHQTKRGTRENNAGSLHMHILLFTDTFIPYETLKKAWGKRGSVDIQALRKIDNVGAYVSKYITKEGQLAEKKSYRTSKNIKKPTIERTTADLNEVFNNLTGTTSTKGGYTINNTYDYKLKRPFEQEENDPHSDYDTVSVIKLKQN